jgi:segregation and condensation protein B
MIRAVDGSPGAADDPDDEEAERSPDADEPLDDDVVPFEDPGELESAASPEAMPRRGLDDPEEASIWARLDALQPLSEETTGVEAPGVVPAAAAEGPEASIETGGLGPDGGSTPPAADGEAGDVESEAAEEKAAPPVSPGELQGAIEAILFSTAEPVTVRQLAEVLEVNVHDVREAVECLKLQLFETERAFGLSEISGGLQFLTQPRFHPWVAKFHRSRKAQRLSSAALETLSVIAYKQPIGKAALESIRGVQCGPILKTLLDRGLVKIVGHEDAIGKPLLYGTTPLFLETFGLASIHQLPQPELDSGAMS